MLDTKVEESKSKVTNMRVEKKLLEAYYSKIPFDSNDEITLDSLDLYPNRRSSIKRRRKSRKNNNNNNKNKIENNIPEFILVENSTKEFNNDPIIHNKKKHNTSSQCKKYRKIIIGFYKIYVPQKVDNIIFLLDKFKNNEIKLMQLVKRIETAYNVILLSSPPYYRVPDIEIQEILDKDIIICSVVSPGQSTTLECNINNVCNNINNKETKKKKKKQQRNNNNTKNKSSSSFDNSLQKCKGGILGFMSRLENAHQSVQSFLDQESSILDEYLLDKNYNTGKKNGK